MATGGRDLKEKKQLEVAYELGKLLGSNRYRLITGCALGVDEHVARGACEGLQKAGVSERDFLNGHLYRKAKHHIIPLESSFIRG